MMLDIEKFIIARWIYSLGEEWISNAEYNLLYKQMEHDIPASPYLKRSWSSDPCPVELLRLYGLEKYIKAVVLSDKTESIESLGTISEVEAFLSHTSPKGTISYKMDGWNVQAAYYNGDLINFQTRGRSSDAMDVSQISDMVPQKIPAMGKVTVIMECLCSDAMFNVCRQQFGNTSQRGAVSTLLSKPEYAHSVSLRAFDILSDTFAYDNNPFPILESWGFQVPKWIEVETQEEVFYVIGQMSQSIKDYDLPTDGLVFRGEATRAFRIGAWEEPIFRTYVSLTEPYAETYGSHRIAMAVNVYPISRDGGTQRVIPVNNLQNIIDWDLQPGSPVAFSLRSHAIAKLEVDATRSLQRAYAGHYDIYRSEIENNEIKRGMML